MKRFLSITLAIALLLGLGSLAVLARPGGSAEPAAAVAQVESSQQTASQSAAPAAPQAGTKYNVIALPLNAVSQFPAGKFNAEGLATILGPGVEQLLEWSPSDGAYRVYAPGLGGNNFALKVGGVYWVALDSSANTAVSFVGDVPAPGAVQFTLVRPTTGACVYNHISLPLDQSGITNALELATSIGNVEQMLEWDAASGAFRVYAPGLGGNNFATQIGYPYLACLLPTGNTIWPAP